MKLLDKNRDSLKNKCPYCHALPDEPCVIKNGLTIESTGKWTHDDFGRLTVHESRITSPNIIIRYKKGIE